MGRNFANKLWNASRFLLMNLDGYTPGPVDVAALPVEDRWILSRLATTAQGYHRAVGGLSSSTTSARTIYEFTWSEFCDWYVEMSKGRLKDAAGTGRGTSASWLAFSTRSLRLDPAGHAVPGRVDLGRDGQGRARARAARAGDGGGGAFASPRGRRCRSLARRGDRGEHPAGCRTWSVASARSATATWSIPKTELSVSVRCPKAVADDFNALGRSSRNWRASEP